MLHSIAKKLIQHLFDAGKDQIKRYVLWFFVVVVLFFISFVINILFALYVLFSFAKPVVSDIPEFTKQTVEKVASTTDVVIDVINN